MAKPKRRLKIAGDDRRLRPASTGEPTDMVKLGTREKHFLEAVPLPCCISDCHGRFVCGNQRFRQFVGDLFDPAAAEDGFAGFFGEISEELQAIDRDLLAGRDARTYDGYLQDRAGQRRKIRIEKSLLRDRKGGCRAILTTLIDRSGLDEAWDAIDDCEMQIGAIQEGFPGVLGYFDRNLQAVWVNGGARRLCEDPVGKSCQDIFCRHKGSCDENCAVSRAISSGHIELSVESVNIRTDDGEEQVFEMTAVPVRNGAGDIGGVMVMGWDVSERHRLEKQLRHTQKMEAIGTLAGGIAHDFNNVLTPIMGYAEILRLKLGQDEGVEKTIAGYVEEILKAARRAKSLVEQILTFSRSQEKKEILQYIHPIVKEVMKLMRITLPATIQIKEDIDEHCGLISVDPVQIHQILINLCTNSAHAMAGGRGTLTVRLAKDGRDEEGREWIELSVADTGCGIEAELLDRIFEPYFTTKEKSRGTGMGLAMVHGIISRQGGRITVESQVGIGTIFRVFLPVSREAMRLDTIVSVTEIMRGKGNILLVDDEEQVVKVTGQMLSNLGYHVVGKTSATEAARLFSESPQDYDLLITDMTMPELTGIELSTQLRQIRPDLPVILFTGYSEQFSQKSAERAGISEYCIKPLTLRELSSVVHRVLRADGNGS